MLRHQFRLLCKTRSFYFVTTFLFLALLGSNVLRVLSFYGYPYHRLPGAHQAAMVWGASIAQAVNFFLLPLLTSVLFADSYYLESRSGVYQLVVSRSSRIRYYGSKFVVVFGVCALAFMVPFLIDQLLTFLSFPLRSVTDIGNGVSYEEAYRAISYSFLSYPLYLNHPYWYNMIHVLHIGLCAGSYGVLALAITCFKIKNRIVAIAATTVGTALLAVVLGVIPKTSMPTEYLASAPGLIYANYSVLYVGAAGMIGLSLVVVMIKATRFRDALS